MLYFLLLILLALIFFNDLFVENYIVKKGKHFAYPFRFNILVKKVLKREVEFNSSCIYNIGYPDQFDINKLFGISYPSKFNSGIHLNSARFGWTAILNPDRIGMFAYVYTEGKLIKEKIGEIEINKEYKIRLEITKQSYIFHVETLPSIEILKTKHYKIGVRSGIYFGGNQQSPQNITIKLK